MRVDELIELLQQMPRDAEVLVTNIERDRACALKDTRCLELREESSYFAGGQPDTNGPYAVIKVTV